MKIVGRTGRALVDINVTPMADIMIVLLIIFMMTAPIFGRDDVRLPTAVNASGKKEEDRTVVVLVRADGATFLNRQRLSSHALLLSLRERLDTLSQPDRIVFLKADESLPYSQVDKILQLCKQAGAEQVALMADRAVKGSA